MVPINETVTRPWGAEEKEEPVDTLPGAAKERRIVTQPFDFAVRSLVDEVEDKNLELQDIYQREFVWDEVKSCRLIESILLNIPLPVCYFAEELDNRRSVVDGQQRLTSIHRFAKGELKLKGLKIRADLNGKKFRDLEPRDQRAFNTRTIRCIVIMRESDPDVRFDIFERLNTQVVGLNAQEVRNCVFRGPFNVMLRRIAEQTAWQNLFGAKTKDSRMQDCEMALRFLALDERLEKYRPSLKTFLNEYMRDNRDASEERISELESRLLQTAAKATSVFGAHALRAWTGGTWEKNTNRALFDAVMLTFRPVPLEHLVAKQTQILEEFKAVSSDPDFRSAIEKATGDRLRLARRIEFMDSVLTRAGIPSNVAARSPPPETSSAS